MADESTHTPIRYRSSTHGVGDYHAIPTPESTTFHTPITVTSYPLNHPKSYIGYTVALAKTESRAEADQIVEKHIINAVDDARRGAFHLDLIAPSTPSGETDRQYLLTERGALVAGKAIDAYGGYDEAISAISDLKGSSKRFSSTHDVWNTVGPFIAQADPSVAYLVPLMQRIHEETSLNEIPLCELTQDYLFELDPEFTIEFFFNDRQTVRDKVVATVRNGEYDVFTDVDSYRATVTYQLKTVLYHFGVVTKPGKDTTNLDPTTDLWGLTDRLS